MALPLVLVDAWATSVGADESPIVRVLLLALGIVLTWLLYVLAARLVLRRLLAD